MQERGSNPPVEVEDGVERSRVPVSTNFTITIIIVIVVAIIIILVVTVNINTNLPIKEVLIVDETVGVTQRQYMLVTSSLQRMMTVIKMIKKIKMINKIDLRKNHLDKFSEPGPRNLLQHFPHHLSFWDLI